MEKKVCKRAVVEVINKEILLSLSGIFSNKTIIITG